MASVKVAIDMGAWNYMWPANETDYDGINDELGVFYVDKDSENKNDYLKGVNNVKPTKVKIVYGDADEGWVPGGETKSTPVGTVNRMCSPFKDEPADLKKLVGKKIKVERRGATVKAYTILAVTKAK